jgi:hypothetical protein
VSTIDPAQRAMSDAGKPSGDDYLLRVDNPLVVPINKKVRLITTADDVIHAFYVPSLGVQETALPGFVRDAWFKAEQVGTYRGQCAELCGKEHGFMPIVVEAVSAEEFVSWAGKHKTAVAPATAGVAVAVATVLRRFACKAQAEVNNNNWIGFEAMFNLPLLMPKNRLLLGSIQQSSAPIPVVSLQLLLISLPLLAAWLSPRPLYRGAQKLLHRKQLPSWHHDPTRAPIGLPLLARPEGLVHLPAQDFDLRLSLSVLSLSLVTLLLPLAMSFWTSLSCVCLCPSVVKCRGFKML